MVNFTTLFVHISSYTSPITSPQRSTMSTNTPIVFIGIPPHSNPTLDETFQAFISNDLSNLRIEPITAFDGLNIPQWNFSKPILFM